MKDFWHAGELYAGGGAGLAGVLTNFDTVVANITVSSRAYLATITHSIPGTSVQCLVEKGKAEEVLIEHASADTDALIVMATDGSSDPTLALEISEPAGVGRCWLAELRERTEHFFNSAKWRLKVN